MKKNFWKLVNRVIKYSDILILLLDARSIEETRNSEVETKIKLAKKPLIYCISKSDLVNKKSLGSIKLTPKVFISAKEHTGIAKLRERILIEGRKITRNKERYIVGVLGYPNVGKSSLINAVRGRKAAPTSSVSGFTKGVQKINAGTRILFLDTPGVIPYKEKDATKHANIGSIDANKVKNPDLVVMDLLEQYPGKIEAKYSVPVSSDFEATIETIAKKRNKILKKGVLDIETTARMILKDWQTGKISR
jgi:ribosome biogenesis GTPase A